MNIDFFKSNFNLCLAPKRNLLGDIVVGYNRKALSAEEITTPSIADEWLREDIEKAKKEASKHGVGNNEVVVFILHYIGIRRWKEAHSFLKLVQEKQNIKAALVIGNSRWFRNNPTLASKLGSKIAKGERTL